MDTILNGDIRINEVKEVDLNIMYEYLVELEYTTNSRLEAIEQELCKRKRQGVTP